MPHQPKEAVRRHLGESANGIRHGNRWTPLLPQGRSTHAERAPAAHSGAASTIFTLRKFIARLVGCCRTVGCIAKPRGERAAGLLMQRVRPIAQTFLGTRYPT